jgi:hypothetical protein
MVAMTDPVAAMSTLYCLGFGLKHKQDATKALAAGVYVSYLSPTLDLSPLALLSCSEAASSVLLFTRCAPRAFVSCVLP